MSTTNITILYYYVHFDFTKFAIFGDPVLRHQLKLRSVQHVMYTVLLVSVLTVRIFEYNCIVCSYQQELKYDQKYNTNNIPYVYVYVISTAATAIVEVLVRT